MEADRIWVWKQEHDNVSQYKRRTDLRVTRLPWNLHVRLWRKPAIGEITKAKWRWTNEHKFRKKERTILIG
jgi:hypothetical protein